MLLIRNGSMIVLIGILFEVFPRDTLPHDVISRRRHPSLEGKFNRAKLRAPATALDAPPVLNFMNSRPVAQLVRALP